MRKAPTLLQIKATQLIAQGYTVHRAMKDAGYSQSSLKQSFKFKKSPAVQSLMADFNQTLIDKGINKDFLGDKFKEWLTAEKPYSSHTEPDRMVPDHDIQIKAYDRLKDIINPQTQDKGLKRTITVSEFIMGDEKQDAS